MNVKIEQIRKDIEAYRQAIRDAEGALEAAEAELEEALEEASREPEPGQETENAVIVSEKDPDTGDYKVLIEVSVNGVKVVSRRVTVTEDLPF